MVAQHEIINIRSEIKMITTHYQVEMGNLMNQLIGFTGKFEKIFFLLKEHQLRIVSLEEKVAGLMESVKTLEDDLKAAMESIDKLDGMNQLWKQNFLVVNATFARLRNSGCLKCGG